MGGTFEDRGQHDEALRLRCLLDTGLLDTAPESAFDDLARLASQICKAPMALVSLVDKDRQWFKARHGLEAEETPREVAFCAHAILRPHEMLAVPDARLDSRFAENPLVTGEMGLRSYFGVPILSPEGLPLGTLCVLDLEPRDLDEHQERALIMLARQVEAQIELRKARNEAWAALRAKARFLEALSHELRTPLHAIIGSLQIILEENQELPFQDDIEAALESGGELGTLLETLLDAAQAERGLMALHPSPTELGPWTKELVQAFQHQAGLRDIDFGFSVDDRLEASLRLDSGRLHQILGYLLRRSLGALDVRRVELRLLLTERGRLRFEIEDDGVHPSDRQIEGAERKQSSVEGWSTQYVLLLPIAVSLLENMGSSVELTEPREGVSLLAFEMEYVPHTPEEREPSPGRPSFGGRVLLVDDQLINLKIGTRALEHLGLEVGGAQGGLPGLDRLMREDWDLVLLDCRMDDLDGFEVARRWRAQEGHDVRLPVVAWTASATEEVRRRCIAAGMDEVLTKPINLPELCATLSRYLPAAA